MAREERENEAQRRIEQLPQILMSDSAQRSIVDVVNCTLRQTQSSSAVDPASTDDDDDDTGSTTSRNDPIDNNSNSNDADDDDVTIQATRNVAQRLRAHGFKSTAIDDALDSVPPDTATSDLYEAALDWLCLVKKIKMTNETTKYI